MTLSTLTQQKLKEFDEQFGKDQYGGIQAFRQDTVIPFLQSSLQEAYEAGEKNKMEYGEPLSTFIQWKGTDVCMDWFCEEGHQNHIDADFAYEIECETCHKIYETGTMIELKKKFTQIKNE